MLDSDVLFAFRLRLIDHAREVGVSQASRTSGLFTLAGTGRCDAVLLINDRANVMLERPGGCMASLSADYKRKSRADGTYDHDLTDGRTLWQVPRAAPVSTRRHLRPQPP